MNNKYLAANNFTFRKLYKVQIRSSKLERQHKFHDLNTYL